MFSFFPKNVIINFCRGNSVGRFLLPLANATSCLKNNGAKTFYYNFIFFFPTGNIVAWKVREKMSLNVKNGPIQSWVHALKVNKEDGRDFLKKTIIQCMWINQYFSRFFNWTPCMWGGSRYHGHLLWYASQPKTISRPYLFSIHLLVWGMPEFPSITKLPWRRLSTFILRPNMSLS